MLFRSACEADGKDLKERLNLKLEAGGFVSGGGVYTVDLTDATGAALDGTTLTFALDAAEFGEDHFSRDYSYYITYTMCGFSGGLDEKGTTYGNSVDVNGVEMKCVVPQSWNGVSRRSFSLQKIQTGDVRFGEDL